MGRFRHRALALVLWLFIVVSAGRADEPKHGIGEPSGSPAPHHPLLAARTESAEAFARRLRHHDDFPPPAPLVEEATHTATSPDRPIELRLAAIQTLGDWAQRSLELLVLRDQVLHHKGAADQSTLASLALLAAAGLATPAKIATDPPSIDPELSKAFERRVLPIYRALLATAAKDPSETVQIEALKAMGKAPRLVASQPNLLLELLQSKSAGIAAQAERLVGLSAAPPTSRLPKLTPYLRASSYAVRAEAAHLIGKMHGDRRPAVPALRTLLSDPIERVRDAAISTLEKLGPQAAEAVPDLMQIIETPRAGRFARGAALRAITSLRPALNEEQALTLAALARQPQLAEQALETLAATAPRSGTAQDAFLMALESPELPLRIAASRGLAESVKSLGATHAERVSRLAASLRTLAEKGEPPIVRQWGLRALGDAYLSEPWLLAESPADIKAAARRFLSVRERNPDHAISTELVRQLTSVSEANRRFAIQAISTRDKSGALTNSDTLAASLANSLRETWTASEHEFVSGYLRRWIEGAGRASLATLVRIVETAPDGSLLQRDAGEKLSQLIQPGDISAIPALIKLLSLPDRALLDPAFSALKRLGPWAFPPLREAVEHTLKGFSKTHAVFQLAQNAQIGGKPEADFFAKFASDDDYQVRHWAVAGLRKMGPKAFSAVKAALARRPSPEGADELLTLVAEGEKTDIFVPELIPFLDRENRELRSRALFALAKSGKAGAPALPKIVSLARHAEPAVRIVALHALGGIDPSEPQASEALHAALTDPCMRTTALEALPPNAARTEQAVIAALKDSDPSFRQSAISKTFTLPESPALLSALVESLAHEETSARLVMSALGRFKAPASYGIPRAMEMLDSPSIPAAGKQRVAEYILYYRANRSGFASSREEAERIIEKAKRILRKD